MIMSMIDDDDAVRSDADALVLPARRRVQRNLELHVRSTEKRFNLLYCTLQYVPTCTYLTPTHTERAP